MNSSVNVLGWLAEFSGLSEVDKGFWGGRLVGICAMFSIGY